MTESEALKHFKDANRKNMVVGILPKSDIEKCVMQALEKQIPKKPILANNMMTKDKLLMCPCCKFRFPDSLVFLKTRCWNCGQKLDWSDEE